MGENNGSPGGLLKKTGLTGLGKRKTTLFRAKELSFKPHGLKFSQIDFPILPASTAALQMDLSGNNRFTGPCFPVNIKGALFTAKRSIIAWVLLAVFDVRNIFIFSFGQPSELNGRDGFIFK